MKQDKQLIIQNNINELNRVVEFLETVEEQWNLPPSIVLNINLVLEEALTNIIFYAYPQNTENEIEIELSEEDHKITIVITDRGIAYDPTKKEDPDIHLPLEERSVGGLGIFMIKNIMDKVSYQRIDNTNRLTLEKKW